MEILEKVRGKALTCDAALRLAVSPRKLVLSICLNLDLTLFKADCQIQLGHTEHLSFLSENLKLFVYRAPTEKTIFTKKSIILHAARKATHTRMRYNLTSFTFCCRQRSQMGAEVVFNDKDLRISKIGVVASRSHKLSVNSQCSFQLSSMPQTTCSLLFLSGKTKLQTTSRNYSGGTTDRCHLPYLPTFILKNNIFRLQISVYNSVLMQILDTRP